jgi:protein-S-isoprenylcysteine O-methyltransferase Ste14
VAVSNRVRGLAWAAIIASTLLLGRLLDREAGLSCPNPIVCIIAGLAWIAVIARAAAVTGRYLAVYGKPRGGRFGEIERLVREGPYSCMRHPMHFFLAQLPPAIGLASASLGSLIVGLAFTPLILYLAVRVDEKESLERFNGEYEEYRRRVPAFSLNPRCIAKALGPRPPKRRET